MTTYSQTNLQNSHLANFWWFLWLTMVYYRSSNMSKSGTMGFHCTVDLQQLSTERPAFIKGFPSGPPECPKASHMMSYVWSFTPWPSWPLHMFHSCAAFSAFNFPDLSPTWLRLQNNTGGVEKRVRFPKRTIEIYRQKRFCQCSWHQMNVCISQNDFPIEWLIEWFMLRMNFPSAGYVPFWRSNVSYELTGKIKPAKQETLTTVYWRLLKKLGKQILIHQLLDLAHQLSSVAAATWDSSQYCGQTAGVEKYLLGLWDTWTFKVPYISTMTISTYEMAI